MGIIGRLSSNVDNLKQIFVTQYCPTSFYQRRRSVIIRDGKWTRQGE